MNRIAPSFKADNEPASSKKMTSMIISGIVAVVLAVLSGWLARYLMVNKIKKTQTYKSSTQYIIAIIIALLVGVPTYFICYSMIKPVGA
jgi:ABC-type antimicrobial peptide transport system permease subunit